MWFAGVVGEDEPDPRLAWHEQARHLPVPILGLVPQRHLEDWGGIGIGSGTQDGLMDSCEVSVSYTLWRNPDVPDDPVNLADLDERLLHELATEPPRPRPQWLVEQVRRLRYPMLWECVRTSWSRSSLGPDKARDLLVEHVNHVVLNHFMPTRGVGPPYMVDSPVDRRCVEPGIPVLVDGVTRAGFRIDTDPDAYGVGVHLGGHAALTAAIPRDALPYLEIAFATRPF